MKIEFYSTIDGVVDTFPIQEAKNCLPSWLGLAKQEYLKNKNDINVYRCPGIVELLTTGFIVSAWHDIDIHIDTNQHLCTQMPSLELEQLLGNDTTQIQGGDSIGKFIPKKPWSHNDILKINTPWNVVVPKDIKLLILPISYTDNHQTESTIGILDPSISNEINIQLYVNATGLLKAGTPLAHIIPLTDEKCELIVRNMNNKDVLWQKKKKFFNNFSFVLNRKVIKKAYQNFYSDVCPFKKWKD